MPKRWLTQEIEVLRERYPELGSGKTATTTKNDLLKLLPDRDWRSITRKAHQLGLARNFERRYEPDLTEIQKAYIAGLFDGEGCVTIEREDHGECVHLHPEVSIGNRDREVLEWVKTEMGFGTVQYKHTSSYRVTSIAGCYRFLKEVLPYLRIKAEEAKLFLRFLEIKQKNQDKWLRGTAQNHITGEFLGHASKGSTREEMDLYMGLKKLKTRYDS